MVKLRYQVDSKTRVTSDQQSVAPNDTGLNTLNQVNKKNGTVKLKKLIRKDQATNQADTLKKSGLDRWYKVETSKRSGKKVISQKDKKEYAQYKQTLNDYKLDPSVEAVEPNYVIKTSKVPNDPYYSSSNSWGQGFGDLYGLKKINPETAWNSYTNGSASAPIAIIDSGIDYNHVEFNSMLFTNKKEVVNSIDDDGNGLIDDTSGWDFTNNDKDPFDDAGHGTHVAGIVTAKGNNTSGVVGVDWTSSIIPIKVFDKEGVGSAENTAKGLKYAADVGAKISNNSWGGYGKSQIIDDAIQYEYDKGMVVVVAAGNSSSDALDEYPSSNQNVITVGATDSQDNIASFSNTGPKVDVVAPGVDILSTKSSADTYCATQGANFVVATNYCRYSGTSMAAPYVTGLASLLLAKNPNYSNEMIRQMIRAGATDLGTYGKDDKFGHGRIDISKSIAVTPQTNYAPHISSPRNGDVIKGSSVDIIGTMQKADATSSQVLEYGYGKSPTTWWYIPGTPTVAKNTKLVSLSLAGIKDGDITIRLRQKSNSSLKDEQEFRVFVKVDNLESKIISPFVAVEQSSGVKITGTAKVNSGVSFSNYNLSWGEGASPSSYSTANIALPNNGTSQVTNGLLGTWNTTALKRDTTYTLKLTVNSTNQNSETFSTTFRTDSDLKAGWPVPLEGSSTYDLTTGDINGDGKLEVISDQFATAIDMGVGLKAYNDSIINAYQTDGTMMPGFPIKNIAGTAGNTEIVDSTPLVDDVDGDGKKEILYSGNVFLNGGFWSDHREINLSTYQGKQYPGFPKINIDYANISYWGSSNYLYPTLADLNKDSKKELIYTEYHDRPTDPIHYALIHARQLNGTELAGFPKQVNNLPIMQSTFSSARPVVADINKDGNIDLVWSYANQVYVFNYANGGLNLTAGWPYSLPKSIVGSDNTYNVDLATTPAIGNIDSDSENEIVLYVQSESDCRYENFAKCRSIIMPLNYNATKPSPNYPILGAVTHVQQDGLITLGDINGDGKDDITVPSIKNGATKENDYDVLRVYDGNAKQISASTLPTNGYPAAIADVEDGPSTSSNPEIATGGQEGDNQYLNIANIVNNSLWKKIIPVHQYVDSITGTTFPLTWLGMLQIADLDNDKKPEIIAKIQDYDQGTDSSLTGIFTWQYPKTKSANMAFNWPMRAHDAQATSNVGLNKSISPSPSPSPSPTPTPTPTPPSSVPAPTGLRTNPNNFGKNPWIFLTYNSVSGATSYNLYRDNSKIQSNINQTTMVDMTAAPLVSHTYKMTSIGSNGVESAPSSAISAKCSWFIWWFCQ